MNQAAFNDGWVILHKWNFAAYSWVRGVGRSGRGRGATIQTMYISIIRHCYESSTSGGRQSNRLRIAFLVSHAAHQRPSGTATELDVRA